MKFLKKCALASVAAASLLTATVPTVTMASDIEQVGRQAYLEALKGKRVILYFYPKDNTPGCTTEACDFRDNATEIDGKEMENYVSWVALTSTLTVTGNPVVSLPCGLDEHGTPFGIQIVGKLHRDREVLAIAHAMERAFSDDPALARPVPALAGVARP